MEPWTFFKNIRMSTHNPTSACQQHEHTRGFDVLCTSSDRQQQWRVCLSPFTKDNRVDAELVRLNQFLAGLLKALD